MSVVGVTHEAEVAFRKANRDLYVLLQKVSVDENMLSEVLKVVEGYRILPLAIHLEIDFSEPLFRPTQKFVDQPIPDIFDRLWMNGMTRHYLEKDLWNHDVPYGRYFVKLLLFDFRDNEIKDEDVLEIFEKEGCEPSSIKELLEVAENAQMYRFIPGTVIVALGSERGSFLDSHPALKIEQPGENDRLFEVDRIPTGALCLARRSYGKL